MPHRELKLISEGDLDSWQAESREPARVGDKVRVKTGLHSGARGVLSGVRGKQHTVLFRDGTRLRIDATQVTNFSAAARRAWRTMPKRAGRPLNPDRKVQVSLRIDAATWQGLGELAENGHIRSREHLTNVLLRRALRRLVRTSNKHTTRTATRARKEQQ